MQNTVVKFTIMSSLTTLLLSSQSIGQSMVEFHNCFLSNLIRYVVFVNDTSDIGIYLSNSVSIQKRSLFSEWRISTFKQVYCNAMGTEYKVLDKVEVATYIVMPHIWSVNNIL